MSAAGWSSPFEFGVDEAEFQQALVSLAALGLCRSHQLDDLHQHRNGNFRLILTTEQRGKAQIRFG